jgi:AcrR family transcriptional regulator
VRLIHTEGAAAVTHQRVAREAGIGRATVYRHWPQQVDLLTDALAQTDLRFLEPAEGTFVERVHADLRRIAKDLNTPEVVAIAATLIERAQWDPATRALRDRLASHAVRNVEVAVREAVASGELAEAPSHDHLAAELMGPLWVRRMLLDAPDHRRVRRRRGPRGPESVAGAGRSPASDRSDGTAWARLPRSSGETTARWSVTASCGYPGCNTERFDATLRSRPRYITS